MGACLAGVASSRSGPLDLNSFQRLPRPDPALCPGIFRPGGRHTNPALCRWQTKESVITTESSAEFGSAYWTRQAEAAGDCICSVSNGMLQMNGARAKAVIRCPVQLLVMYGLQMMGSMSTDTVPADVLNPTTTARQHGVLNSKMQVSRHTRSLPKTDLLTLIAGYISPYGLH